MIRKSVWAVVFLMLAAVASPGLAFAIPAGANMMPMHSGSETSTGQTAGCNCGMPMPAAAALPRTESPARTAAEPMPCSSSAIPMYSGMAGASGRVSGIRRIYPKNVLDHPERAAVYTAIVARPGIDLAGISSELSLNRETLRYHLDQLESNTRIVVMRDHGIIRYYENHGRYTPAERRVLQHLWNPTGKQILALVAANPGITQGELSARLAVTAPTVRWYMQRFRTDGLVTDQHEGKYTRYTMVPEVSRFVLPVTADRTAIAIAA